MDRQEKNMNTMKISFWKSKMIVNPKVKKQCEEEIAKLEAESKPTVNKLWEKVAQLANK